MRFHFPAPSVEQARHIVINYSRRMASVKWTCRADMDYTKEKSYTSKLKYTAGETYYGPIYVSNARNMDKFLLTLDENGVYTGALPYAEAVGNTCASAVRVSYDNVSAKIKAGSSFTFLPMANAGVVKVGDYEWDFYDNMKKVVSLDTVKKNGEQRMCEAYALLVPGDAISARWPAKNDPTVTNGHARLISGPTHVVRLPDGTIDPKASTVTVIEQNGSFNPDTPYKTTWRVEKPYSFASLLSKGYLPVTLEEFAEGKLEDATVDFENVTCDESLFETGSLSGNVTSSHMIMNVKASLFDENDTKVASVAYAPQGKSVNLSDAAFSPALTSLPNGTYRLRITARIGYGTCVYCDKNINK